jgi:hypothetical protein
LDTNRVSPAGGTPVKPRSPGIGRCGSRLRAAKSAALCSARCRSYPCRKAGDAKGRPAVANRFADGKEGLRRTASGLLGSPALILAAPSAGVLFAEILFAEVLGFLTAATLALRGGGGGRSRATASPARLKAIASPANIDNARTAAGCLPPDGILMPSTPSVAPLSSSGRLAHHCVGVLDILRQSACGNCMWVNPSPNGRVVSRSETGWGFVRPSRAMRSPRLPHPAANAAKFTQAA